MDDRSFDQFSMKVGLDRSRRSVLRLLASGVLGFSFIEHIEQAEAKYRNRQRRHDHQAEARHVASGRHQAESSLTADRERRTDRDHVSPEILRRELAASEMFNGRQEDRDRKTRNKKSRREALEAEDHDVFTMRAPWASYQGYQYPTWRVTNGYGQGTCHNASACGGDQTYGFDMIPTNANAGGRLVFAPVAGKVEFANSDSSRPTIGKLVKIATYSGAARTGYVVHLYHLMDLRVTAGQTVRAGDLIGWVYNNYGNNSANNHLHMHVSYNGRSVELRFAGRFYAAGNSWKDTLIRNNTFYSGPNYSGDKYAILATGSRVDWPYPAAGYALNYIGNDNLSSIRLNDGCRMTIYQHTYYMGSSRQISAPGVGSLFTMDNQTSSFKLTCS